MGRRDGGPWLDIVERGLLLQSGGTRDDGRLLAEKLLVSCREREGSRIRARSSLMASTEFALALLAALRWYSV